MKKILCAVLAASILLLSVTGCGKKPEEQSSSDPSAPDAVPAAATAGDTVLTVYSPLPQRLAQAAADGFAAQSGIQVELVCDSASALITKIVADAAAPVADVLFGGGAEVVQQMNALFTPYQTAEETSIDKRFLSADGLWTPLSPMPVVLFYNKSQTSKAPAGWEAFTLNSYKGWIAFANPATSGTSYTALCAMQEALKTGKLTGDALVEKFAANLDGKMLADVSEVYRQVAAGNFAAGITLESSALKYIAAGHEKTVGIAYPSEGTTAALEVSAVVKGAPHEDYAQQFIDYVSGKEFQELLVSDFDMRTARTDVTDAEGLTPMKDIVLVDYNYAGAVSGRDALLKTFDAAITKAKADTQTSSTAT